MTETGDLNEQSALIEAAAALYAQSQAALYDDAGKPRYAAAEMNTRLAAMLAPLRKLADEAIAAMLTEADSLEILHDVDPLSYLRGEQLQEALAWRPFVQEFVERESLPALANRLRAVLLHGHLAEKMLYARYLSWRSEALHAQKPPLADGELGILQAIDEAVAELRQAILPVAIQEALARAALHRQEAEKLETLVNGVMATLVEAQPRAAQHPSQHPPQD